MLELPPLSLYVHIPWCVRKCPYCDFNSHEFSADLPQDAYIDALCRDLRGEVSRAQGRPLQSIFIGGGTPSLFDASSYDRLLVTIADLFQLSESLEITLEANPGTMEAGRFESYRELGINRLSIGVQSFDDLQLQRLGRIHDSLQARSAVVMAKQAGFDSVNLDLMHGLPGQQPLDALRDLQIALDLRPDHLSWYQLTIEPNTVFYRRPPSLPEEPVLDEIQQSGHRLLGNFGYQQYEVSAYARPTYRSRHNYNYWSFGDYVGVGAGAHGKLTLASENRVLRTRKLRQPAAYLAASEGYDAESRDVPDKERALEFLMNALRLTDGFSREHFEAATGLPFNTIAGRVESLRDQGLLEQKQGQESPVYAASTDGYRMLDSVLQEFL